MLPQYRFVDEGSRLRVHHYVGLMALVVMLAWKLFRGISPTPASWYLHVIAIVCLAFASALTLMSNRFRVRIFDLSLPVLVFCVLVVLRTFVFGNFRDPFTVASLAFCAHLFLASLFTKVSDRSFFRGLSFILFTLVITEILGIIDYVYEWGIIDYQGMESIEGVAPIEGAYGGRSFLLLLLDLEVLQGFFGRLSGISGTPYATGGLMSAIAAFGLASGRKLLVLVAVLALLLSSTGSAVVALFISAVVILRKSPWMYIPLAFLVPVMLIIFEAKGLAESNIITEVYLPVEITTPFFYTFAAAIIGEGRHVSSIDTEMRVLGMLFSLGLAGVLCLVAIINGGIRAVQLPHDPEIRRDYCAAGYFVLTLFLSTLHYNTFFIYPNIVFVVVFVALISSRLRISHAAGRIPETAVLGV